MISPRWLVEAGAVGTLGVALVAVPLALVSVVETADDGSSVDRQWVQPGDRLGDLDPSIEGAAQDWKVRIVTQYDEDSETRVYVQRVGYRLTDGDRVRQCLVDPFDYEEDDSEEAVDEARSVVDTGVDDALEESFGVDDEEDDDVVAPSIYGP